MKIYIIPSGTLTQWRIKISKTTRRILLDLQLIFNLQMAMNEYRVWFKIIKCLRQWVKTRWMRKTKLGNDGHVPRVKKSKSWRNIEKRTHILEDHEFRYVKKEKNTHTQRKVIFETAQTHMPHNLPHKPHICLITFKRHANGHSSKIWGLGSGFGFG